MASIASAIAQLDSLLLEAGAKPRLQADRIVRSTLYDPDYHVAMVACGLNICADSDGAHRSILRAWLRPTSYKSC